MTVHFEHVFTQGTGTKLFILLHGTGADEHDLLPLAKRLDATASILSPRGKSEQHGMLRWFKLPENGEFDQQDLETRTEELALFLKKALKDYKLDKKEVYVLGFSNGANMAANLLLQSKLIVKGALLFKALLPGIPKTIPTLSDTHVFLSRGERDDLIPPEKTQDLIDYLRESKAHLHVKTWSWGHELHVEEIKAAHDWLENH